MRTTLLLSLALAATAGAQTLQIPQGGTGGDTAGKAAANLSITQKCPGTSGVGTAYVCVTSGTFTPTDGSTINFQPDVNSGATPTLSVNTHSATIKTVGGGAIGASDLLAGNWYLVTYHTTGSTYWSVNLAGTSGITQLTGDGTAGPGSGSKALTLATVNAGPGACGDSTNVCVPTTNGKGLVTSQTTSAIAFGTANTSGTNGVYTIAWDGTIDEDVTTGALDDNTPTSITLPHSFPAAIWSCTCSDNSHFVQDGNPRTIGCNEVGLSAAYTTVNVTASGSGSSATCHIRGK